LEWAKDVREDFRKKTVLFCVMPILSFFKVFGLKLENSCLGGGRYS
jgi:hypothetical protein